MMKKISYILLILLSFLVVFDVQASVDTKKRDESNNYGVNKKWQISNRNYNNVMNTYYVDASEYVYDFADVLEYDLEYNLKTRIAKFREQYKTEIIIMTISLPYTDDSENETYATDFYDYNDFGIDFRNYDGILIYRNVYQNDPYYDIYTFGTAQLYFDTNRYDKVLDGVYNYLHASNYDKGFNLFIDYIERFYKQGRASKFASAYIDDMGYIKYNFNPPYLIASLISLGVSFVIGCILVGKNKLVRKEMKADAYLDLSTINYSVKENTYINSRTTSYTVSSSSGGGGGGHSSSGSSGGGHSSGGGRHG